MSIFDDYLPWTPERLNNIPDAELHNLLKTREDVTQDQSVPITNLMVLLYNKQHGHIDLTLFKSRRRLVEWFRLFGQSIYNLNSFFAVIHRTSSHSITKEKGINLVGYSKGQLGLGEDLRAFAKVLDRFKVSYSVFSIGHPSDNPKQYADLPESNALPYSHSIFFMNAIELGKLIKCYSNFKAAFGYTIAVPPWELSRAPSEWQETLQQFDEVWAMSQFVHRALHPICDKLKYSAPVVLESPLSKSQVKRQHRPFTFMYMFDSASFLSRKNPEAAIQAFLSAFPDKTTPVRLLLKSTPLQNSGSCEALLKLVGSDSRIALETKLVSHSELDNLWGRCHCYLSLHRSEGFGRTIAEAVVRNIPVIATDWSGNTDITGPDYELGVSYELIDVAEHEYPYSDNQVWSEPKIADAAQKMKWVYENQNSEDLRFIVTKLIKRYHDTFSVNATRPSVEELFDMLRIDRQY